MIFTELDARGRAILAEGMKLAGDAGILTVTHVLLAFLATRPSELRTVESVPQDTSAPSVEYDTTLVQAACSACAWARRRGEQVTIEHLVVVIIDQASADAFQTLRMLNVEPLTLRRAVLGSLSIIAEEPAVELIEISAAAGANFSMPGETRYATPIGRPITSPARGRLFRTFFRSIASWTGNIFDMLRSS